jgi:ectoine hydroxylase-related dioxygenase (phytanoyl-CoA dioxygenase family)
MTIADFGGDGELSVGERLGAGDALIFGMFTMHGSLTNTTDRYRISVDTRYQLASEPVDERWIGKKPKGHYAWGKGKTVSMKEARKQWGV